MPRLACRFIISMAALILLSACSTLPENLKADSMPVTTDYQAWNSGSIKSDSMIRLGGMIADVRNLADKTRVEVVNIPIDKTGRPNIDTEPSGRFVAYIDGFVDPVTFAKGRLVTVLGAASGTEKGKVGQYDYIFPVMKGVGYHLWRVEERVIVNDFNSHYYPCRGIFCRDPFPRVSEGQVIQVVK
ncbi:Slp family lipoprotein [Vibrio sp. NTOU-M3]|uniref:Slp family lipoprotein n=1 Tax=Vibrio sp. NTOU-M3 TaxID=3234954 RepID=UPI00349FC32D